MRKARIFSNILRFIDDLCPFINDEFENTYNDIYLDELELKKENEDPCKASFLEFPIEAFDKKFTTILLGKRDAFAFYINRMAYLYMDIPSKMFYALVGSEFLRFVSTTTDLINIATRVNLLLIWMEK